MLRKSREGHRSFEKQERAHQNPSSQQFRNSIDAKQDSRDGAHSVLQRAPR